MKPEILVLDAVMGSGKTNTIINRLRWVDQPVLYIAPLLSECHRIAGTIEDEDGGLVLSDSGIPAYQTNHPLAHKMFHHPNLRNKAGSKLESIKALFVDGKNIVSTHQLFRMLDTEIFEWVRKHNYILVIDEVLSVWCKYSLRHHIDSDNDGDSLSKTSTDKEIEQLIRNGFICVCNDGLLQWQNDKYDPTNTSHEEVKRLCDMGQLSMISGKVVYWELNKDLIASFGTVWIATYMFHASYMSRYLAIHNFKVTVEKFGRSPSSFKHLIDIVDGKINTVGDGMYDLSYSDMCSRSTKKSVARVDQCRKSLETFFRSMNNTSPSERLWTTFKPVSSKIAGRRYKTSWLAFSTKATNDYACATHVAYICNNFANTFLLQLLKIRGEDFDQDLWALSEMLQWVWRSSIRNGHPIKLFVPSSRMRDLLQRWLSDEFEQMLQKPVDNSVDVEYDGFVGHEMPVVIWEGLE